MAFLLSFSSSIVKRLLLFSLARLDILDKDPSDFVDVSVGKKSTLELRDVGLRIDRLTSILHLDLPPQLRLTSAKVSVLRLTLTLDPSNPGIRIEVDGIRLNIVLDSGSGHDPSEQRPSSPYRTRKDREGKEPGENIPSAEDLAKSFLQEEPARERQQLEEAFHSQSQYVHEAQDLSDEDDEADVGMGTAPSLPGFFENFIRGALDRCEVVISGIDIRLDAEIPPQDKRTTTGEAADISMNFWIQRAIVDGLASPAPELVVASNRSQAPGEGVRDGQRRISLQNIGAEIISTPELFASLSRYSRPSSPGDTRSNVSGHSRRTTGSTTSSSSNSQSVTSQSTKSPLSESIPSSPQPESPIIHRDRVELPLVHSDLEASQATNEDDRFADAASDYDPSISVTDIRPLVRDPQVSQVPFEEDEGESILQDRSFLMYAMNNGMWDSRIDSGDTGVGSSLLEDSVGSVGDELFPRGQTYLPPSTSSDAGSAPSIHPLDSSVPELGEDLDDLTKQHVTTDNKAHALEVAGQKYMIPQDEAIPNETSPPIEDLSQSRIYDHDDAESMYMSAYSEAPSISRGHHIPGGWESETASSDSGVMEALTRQDDATEVDEAYTATPRSASRASTPKPSPSQPLDTTPTPGSPSSVQGEELLGRVTKPLLHIDNIAVWFPWPSNNQASPDDRASHDDLVQSTVFGEETMHQDMPGAYSTYVDSQTTSHKRTPSPSSMRSRPDPAHMPSSQIDGNTKKITPPLRFDFEIGVVQTHVDLTVGQLLIQAAQFLQKTFDDFAKDKPTVKKSEEKREYDEQRAVDYKVSINEISIHWLENIPTSSFSRAQSVAKNHDLDSHTHDIILQLRLSGTRSDISISSVQTKIKFAVYRMAFGLQNEDIIAFDDSAKLRPFVKGMKDPGSDITIEYLSTNASSRLDVFTLPVRISLNTQKLDDAFTSFGGFSGMLELGNSMSSNSTIQPRHAPPVSRPRGVHFSRVPPAPATDLGLTLKINARIGGATCVLKGKSCAVQARTTAIKVVGRSPGFKIHIDQIKITGPHVDKTDDATASLALSANGTRIDFLFMPEETDLTRLLTLLTPSKDKYEDDDDILVDALLRQRQKGSILRLTLDSAKIDVNDSGDLQVLAGLGEELSKLSTVTKYLPEDDRPGLLTLAYVKQFDSSVYVNENIGVLFLATRGTRVAHVGWPALLAVEVAGITARRGEDEILIHEIMEHGPLDDLPMIMARKVGDEVEPTVKVKLHNVCIEYRVSTIMSLLALKDGASAEDIATGLAESVATITSPEYPATLTRQSSTASVNSGLPSRQVKLDLLLRDSAIGLNPRDASSKALVVFTETRFTGIPPKDGRLSARLELRKASLLLIDDNTRFNPAFEIEGHTPPRYTSLGSKQVTELCSRGFVSVSTISSAFAEVNITGLQNSGSQEVSVDFRDDLFLMQTCADSTQTLISLLSGLAPPLPPSKELQYRTQVVPMDDMMASFTGDYYTSVPEEAERSDHSIMDDADTMEDDLPANLEFVGSFYNPEPLPSEEELGDGMLDNDLFDLTGPEIPRQIGQSTLLESFEERYELDSSQSELNIEENYFGAEAEAKGKARKWNSERKQYGWENEFKATSPLKVRVRDVQIIWHLFDGYDWAATRDVLTEAVEKVEQRAEERRQRLSTEEDDEVRIEEDFLFNSVWISLPVGEERGTLAKKINREIDDLTSETGSYATSTTSRSTAHPRSHKSTRKGLRLERSRHHKISFELSGVSADIVIFPPGTGETQSSIDLRVTDFDIFDHVPTSTWRKFATYMRDAGERELGRPQIHLEILNVRPVPTLAASELVIKVSVLPMRLHVDQDALDFITRFFEFKDDSAPSKDSKTEEPFIQRLEVNTVQLKLDYKPKKVDYAGLRSGRSTEFMNFFILDASDIVLRHCILYGISGFDKVHDMLNDVWMPDVKRNQLPGVLAGLAPVRPLVNVGSGVRDLIVIPMREYRKNGRIVRSIQKGAVAFAKTTTTELARLGARMAIGTQNVLQGAEGLLSPATTSASPSRNEDWEDLAGSPSSSDSPPRAVSSYADQPLGVMAGLRGAARSLERDLLTARDAIIAIPGEVMESSSPGGAALAVARRAPTVILRPASGAMKAVGMALHGVGNEIDREGRRRVADKYKRY
ncbi:hypothetical protein EJ05DRAFT_360674 [Pseudovirgaria hyperparasitica]|uniref:Autophagy-related protein 2 n=1 Tax=Pseudovirgaria hyperparasitica TaxID=470096 RepID=A0A6A6WC23_9PEZI|nr:uncharacterized protein EJ05DRAFT_360674 [Pseudovirgaria hyperparasitica]KAF2758661.1 hypothetical protein EJ05DRAFT_360674 [Pseudovirgaria hyperparasitica]